MVGESTLAFECRFSLMVKYILFIGTSRKFYEIEAELVQMLPNFLALLGLETAMLELDRVDLDADGECLRNTTLDLIDDANYDTGAIHE